MSDHPRTALFFDLFGTVFDWRSTLTREVGSDLAKAWARGYAEAVQRISEGREAYRPLSLILEEIGMRHGLPIEQLDLWARLDPFPDSVEALANWRDQHKDVVLGSLFALSNAEPEFTRALSDRSGIVWDGILSAAGVERFKPAPEVYRQVFASRLLCSSWTAAPVMVAAHPYDLRAARLAGMRTAFVRRPGEFSKDDYTPGEFDFESDDLAGLLGLIAQGTPQP